MTVRSESGGWEQVVAEEGWGKPRKNADPRSTHLPITTGVCSSSSQEPRNTPPPPAVSQAHDDSHSGDGDRAGAWHEAPGTCACWSEGGTSPNVVHVVQERDKKAQNGARRRVLVHVARDDDACGEREGPTKCYSKCEYTVTVR